MTSIAAQGGWITATLVELQQKQQPYWQWAVKSGKYCTPTSVPDSASSKTALQARWYSAPIQLQSSFTGSSPTHTWRIVAVMHALQRHTWVSSGLLPAGPAA